MQLHPLVQSSLRDLAVEYDVLECDPAFADTALFCERYGIDPADSANTILVASKRPAGQLVACVALATTRLDVNRAVRDRMGVKKLSFASPEATLEASGMEIGGVTPFGLQMPVLVDDAVMGRESIILGGGNRVSKLRVSPDALRTVPNVEIVSGLANPSE